jgi:hypothetical protein
VDKFEKVFECIVNASMIAMAVGMSLVFTMLVAMNPVAELGLCIAGIAVIALCIEAVVGAVVACIVIQQDMDRINKLVNRK